ncbi:glycosyltransferase family 2 protein [Algoriphagus sp. AGSA1]|uniref:glycosyltransferase family 2 protein n=1 Tax=Algoriphagus sp. AGSA1 TaxID=2907213 RepID=UPI001F29FA6E|nr:glycosyltransferase family 2 protein [Algoriphagus sp. AGSA1]MCE7055295.1 glycosyltransferase family 2 protein [Algoriphagus sp. AGSA1]
MIQGLVSVIIPTHGRPKFLVKSIESVLNQNYPSIELIVVDDNGKDDAVQLETAKVISTFQEKASIEYIIHEENCGGGVARNTGAKAAKGEFLTFLDDDDEYEPARVARQVEFLQQKAREDQTIKSSSCLVIRRKYGEEIDRQEPKKKENYMVELLALDVSFYTSTLLIYTDVFLGMGGFDERFRRNQDVEFMVRYFREYNGAMLNEYLTVLNIEDRSHIPSNQKIVETKEMFLSKFEPIISELSAEQQKLIYKNNALEIAKVALWNKNLSGFFKGAFKAKLSLVEWIGFLTDVGKKALMHLK